MAMSESMDDATKLAAILEADSLEAWLTELISSQTQFPDKEDAVVAKAISGTINTGLFWHRGATEAFTLPQLIDIIMPIAKNIITDLRNAHTADLFEQHMLAYKE